MSQLPDYVASAKPNPKDNRAPWLTTTAATYAGIMLWFAFWQDVPGGGGAFVGGVLTQGLGIAIAALVLASFLCYFCCFLVPGLLGMKTGLGLSVVGTSTYGVKGGYLMPGFLMGVLQFGWLSVNAYFAGLLLTSIFVGQPLLIVENAGWLSGVGIIRWGIGLLWIFAATFVGMKGVKYVGMVSSFTPIIPIAVLVLILVSTYGGMKDFSKETLMSGSEKAKTAWSVKQQADPQNEVIKDSANKAAIFHEIAKPASLYGNEKLGVISLICAFVFGFFATAGAAGVDFGSNNKDAKAVQLGGIFGIVLATILTGTIALIAVVGIQGKLVGEYEHLLATYKVTALFEVIMGNSLGNVCMLLLCLAAFPSACFPTLVASAAFKTTFPKINPLYTCGLGVLVAIGLVVSSAAGQAGAVFGVVGASFGPICGAMMADYLLSGCKWAGPREGFNLAGWISWFFGFLVGGTQLALSNFFGMSLPFEIPCPPLAAFVVGFVLYIVCAGIGLQSKTIPMPQRIDS